MLDRVLKLARDVGAYINPASVKAKTGPQNQTEDSGVYSLLRNMQPQSGQCMWSSAPEAGIKTWRKMQKNPTVALALATAKAPVRAAEWSVEADDGVPEERIQLIRDYIMPLRPALLGDGLRAIDYGRQPFEIVWTLDNGKMVPAKLKPLLPEKTDILRDEKTGAFTGLKNGDVTLDPMDSLVVSFDGEAGDLNGQSRLENIRERAWWPWEQILTRISQYTTKAAGIIPILHYPVGDSVKGSTTENPNASIARDILNRVGSGGAIAMPTKLPQWAEAALARGIDVSKLATWNLEFVEARNSHGTELSALLDKFEALMVRGLLQPERSILEGQNGTKAEAGTHQDVSISIAEDTAEQLMRIINWHLVDKVLVQNFGPEAAGTVRVCSAPLVDEQVDLLRQIMVAVLTDPANLDLLASILDLDAAMEQTGLPIKPGAQMPEPGEFGHAGNADPNVSGEAGPIVASIFKAAKAMRSIA